MANRDEEARQQEIARQEREGIVHVPESSNQTPAPPERAAQKRAQLEEEWSQYRAKRPIYVDGVRAFNPGDAVPVSHIKAYRYDKEGLVEEKPAER